MAAHFLGGFELLGVSSVMEAELTFFEKHREAAFGNAVVRAQHALGLDPKVLDAIDVISPASEFNAVLDAHVVKLTEIQCVMAVKSNISCAMSASWWAMTRLRFR